MRSTRSGVCLARHESTQRMPWLAALDLLGLPLLLFDNDGEEIHRTAVAQAILAQEQARTRIQVVEAAKQIAHEQLLHSKPYKKAVTIHLGPRKSLATKIRVSDARSYSLRAARIDETEGLVAVLGQPVVLVAVDRRTPLLPSVQQLRAQFALTRREAEVALLLGQRRHNDEIAEILCVSVHTARHHTERVLEKLAIRRRTDVMRVLQDTEGVLRGLILLGLIVMQAIALDIVDIGFRV